MRIRFWGTRGSIGTAGPSTLRYGGNTSCVELVSAGGTRVVLDCGTGAAPLGRALAAEDGKASGHLFVTHAHWDHIQGFPFFAPLFPPHNAWDVYGPRNLEGSLRDIFAGQMEYEYFPINLDTMGAGVRFHDLVEGTLLLRDDVRVTAHYQNHPAITLGYRLEADGATVVYVADHEPHAEGGGERGYERGLSAEDDRYADFLCGADLVIHDAPYAARDFPMMRGRGHSSVEYAVDVALAAGVKRLALYHHDPACDDDALDDLLALARQHASGAEGRLEVTMAAEGQELVLEGGSASPSLGPGERPTASRVPQALAQRTVLAAVGDGQVGEAVVHAVRADSSRLLHARDAADVLRAAQDGTASLLLLGCDGLGGSALEVCRAVRDLGSELPVVMVASREEQFDSAAGAAAGVSDWLVAPFKHTHARARIGTWLLRSLSGRPGAL